MIPTRTIKKIELGPRQMTFGFDTSETMDPDVVYPHIEKEYQTNGPVELQRLAESLSPGTGNLLDILQAVFWLAQDLKVYLYIADQPVSPFQAKQALINDSDTAIEITINQPVDQNRFDRAMVLAKTFLPSVPENPDQYTVSRAVANTLESWHTRLTAYLNHPMQPNLPGNYLINNCLVLIDRLIEKKNSSAIILALVKYGSKIHDLSGNVQTLSNFYTRKLSFWALFTEQMADFKQNMEIIREDEQIHSIYRKLNGILKAPCPFDQVEQAERLLPELSAFHHRIEQQKTDRLRKACLDKTDKMIRKLSALFDTFDAKPEDRNNTLHELRNLNKKIHSSLEQVEIEALFNDAKDLFVDIIETI